MTCWSGAAPETVCAHPERCQGTDAGGNCRLMRSVPWRHRTCRFNSEVWRDSPEGRADTEAQHAYALEVARTNGMCSNCFQPEHEVGGCTWPDWYWPDESIDPNERVDVAALLTAAEELLATLIEQHASEATVRAVEKAVADLRAEQAQADPGL